MRTHWKVSPCVLLRDKFWLKPSIARWTLPTRTDRICPRCVCPRWGGWRTHQHRAPSHTGSLALWHLVNSDLFPWVISSTEVKPVSTQPQRTKGEILRSCILSCGTRTGWHSCWHTRPPTTPEFRHRALSASWPQHYNLFLSFCQCSHLLTFQSLLPSLSSSWLSGRTAGLLQGNWECSQQSHLFKGSSCITVPDQTGSES